jgi:hypothetical protein
MPSVSTAIVALCLACLATVLMAAAGGPLQHMVTAAVVALAFAGFSVYELNTLAAASASELEMASATARHCALVWAWGAVSILIIYVAVFPGQWREWWQFVLGFGFAALTAAAFSKLLDQDVARGQTDRSLIKIGRSLLVVQAVGAGLGVVSMIADGKFPRAQSHPDWAACNIFVFGALAIAVISVHALRSAKSS